MSMRGFFAPNNLQPPDLRFFWPRYLLMTLMGIAALFVIPQLRPQWFSWDVDTRSVRCFGVLIRQQLPPAAVVDASATSFQDFVNTVLHFALSLVFLAYALLTYTIYGWKRCAAALKGTNFGRVFVHVAVLLPGVLLAGRLMETFGMYSGDPASAATPRVFSVAFAGILGMTVLIPLGEELFVRFTLFQGLRSKFSFLVAASVASIVFGLMHLGYPDHRKIVIGCLVSLLWCWTYERTGSILTPIGIHIGNDLFHLIMKQLP